MRLLFICLLITLVSLALADDESVSDQLPSVTTNKSTNSQFSVKETFNVGNNVFVRSLSFDEHTNTLWVGTSVGVLAVDAVTGEAKKTITRENGLANEYVFASFVSQEKDIWFGTNGGGVSRLTSNGWKTYFPLHGLADYWVYSFVEQPQQAMWIGTWAGLSRFDYKTEKFTTYFKELVNEWVYGLGIDSRGHLWIGTEGGVNRFDGKTWSTWTQNDGLGAFNNQDLLFSSNTGLGTRSRHDLSILNDGRETYNPNYVFCIKISADDTVWAGTWGGGASWFNGNQWQNLTTDDGLAGNIVYSIEANQDELWFGTNKGISWYDGEHWQTIDRADGLLDSHIYALAIDGQNRIWAGTRHGVALIQASKSP